MTAKEREEISRRANAYSDFIKQQHRLPKAQRDHKKLKYAHDCNRTMLKWLEE